MKSVLKLWVRILLFICGAALIYVLYVPMWRIDLVAPQYPEGLRLLIFPDHIGGSVDIINGLNHYIGMKTLHTEDFIEFKILPIIISVFAGLFFLVALLNRVRWMNILFVLFVLFGIVAMADFWRWEYNYGHNLDPNAAIIVPGMAYQPPLIGFKQLLNFGAYSIPDIGGSIFLGVGVLLLICVFITYRMNKKSISAKTLKVLSLVCLSGLLLSACSDVSEPIKYGKDNCYYCKMTISDRHFGAEILTNKGKYYKYDELSCLLSDMKKAGFDNGNVKTIFITDYCGSHQLIARDACHFLRSLKFHSPMGGNTAAFSNHDSLKIYQSKLGGEMKDWKSLTNE